jgi:citrate/tricarballylate utilization protein
MPALEDLVPEAERQFRVCNACRYCEAYCPVFPAIERKPSVTAGDLSYVANVCHDCRACYQACMYTDPHEFAIDIPALLREGRLRTYERYARPRWLAGSFQRGGLTLLLATLASFAVILVAYELVGSLAALFRHTGPPADFYEIVSHTAMVVPALLLSAFVLTTAGLGLAAFWRDTAGRSGRLTVRTAWIAAREAATLRWLRGGGGECFVPNGERPTPVRRRLHHLVAYWFMATFAATVCAWAAETLLPRPPPYALLSVPVALGLIGGAGITIGCAGLLALRTAPLSTTDGAGGLELSFILALLAVAVTGIALLVVRESAAMGAVLVAHLATVAVLYLTIPYGKFMHAIYRTGALLRDACERAGEDRGSIG